MMKLLGRFILVLIILGIAAAGFLGVLWLIEPVLPQEAPTGNLSPTEQQVPVREVMPQENAPEPDAENSSADATAPLSEEAAEAYRTAKTELRSALEERQEEIDPEVMAPVKENLNILEKAVVDILAALADDPDNESLRRLLVQAYENEVGLLKKALHLGGDTADAAAGEGVEEEDGR